MIRANINIHALDANGDFLLVPVNMTTAERMKKGTYGAKADEK